MSNKFATITKLTNFAQSNNKADTPMTKEEFLSSPVTKLLNIMDRSRRSTGAIINAYPDATIHDLVSMGKNELLKTHNVGKRWLTDFDDLLEIYGVSWHLVSDPEQTPEAPDNTLEQFIQMALQQFREGITGISMELDSPYGLECILKIEVKPKQNGNT